MSSCIRSADKQEGGTQPTGFWAHGMDVMCEERFLPSCHDFRQHRGQKRKAQLLPHVLRLDMQGHNHLSPLHIKLCVTLEIGQDHKVLMSLQLINNLFCSLEKLH